MEQTLKATLPSFFLSNLNIHPFPIASPRIISGSDVPGASAQSISAPIAMELKQTINLKVDSTPIARKDSTTNNNDNASVAGGSKNNKGD